MSNLKRRKILKSIAAGSSAVVAGKALPEQWTKPVVDAVILPAHAETTDSSGGAPGEGTTTCAPCLVAATYCAGSGQSSMQIQVAVDGTVTVVHSNGTGSDTLDDPCVGGDFSVTIRFSDGDAGTGTIIVAGTIPCGAVDSIDITETDTNGQNPTDRTATLCTPG